jgi:hypothetical protein
MNRRIESSEIISWLKSVSIISSLTILSIDEILTRSVLKVRCNLLPSSYHLDVRLIQTESETIYSYQLFTDQPIVRWDNAPHFPAISTFPHHYHSIEGQVEESALQGNIFKDMEHVIKSIKEMIASNDF